MTRTQFTFYESFFKAIRRIKSKSARADAYDAICAYALWGEEPELDKLPDAAAIAFEVAKPNLDASRRKAAGGQKGGEHRPGEGKKRQAQGKEEKKKVPCYGAYQNVMLTDEELAKLQKEFPDWQGRVERLSAYMAQSGKHYSSHYATLRSWARRDAEKLPRRESEQSAVEQMKRMHAHMTGDPLSHLR